MKTLALAAALAAACAFASCAHKTTSQARLDFRLSDMNGHDVSLATYAGKPLVVNFWATWCGPCRLETPQLVTLSRKYRAQGLAVVGISVDDDADAVRKFATEFHVSYPMLVGLDRDDVQKAYGYEGLLPLSVFVRKDGSIAGRAVGLQTDEYWTKRVEALF